MIEYLAKQYNIYQLTEMPNQQLTPQDCTIIVLLSVLSKLILNSNYLMTCTTDDLMKSYKKILPKLESMKQASTVLESTHIAQTLEERFDDIAEGPPEVPSSAILPAMHHQTFSRAVSLQSVGQGQFLGATFRRSGNTQPSTLGISRSSRRIKKATLPKSPRKNNRVATPKRIQTRQENGQSLEYDNPKKDIQKKAVNYWDHILRVETLKTEQFREKRYLAACLQVSCLKAKDHFTDFIYCILIKRYFKWLDEKIAYEEQIWKSKEDPISKRTIQVYKLAKKACLLLEQRKWFESIELFFDNSCQKEKLSGNIIFFLGELALFNPKVSAFMQSCGNLTLKTPQELEQTVKQLELDQPLPPSAPISMPHSVSNHMDQEIQSSDLPESNEDIYHGNGTKTWEDCLDCEEKNVN